MSLSRGKPERKGRRNNGQSNHIIFLFSLDFISVWFPIRKGEMVMKYNELNTITSGIKDLYNRFQAIKRAWCAFDEGEISDNEFRDTCKTIFEMERLNDKT